MSTFVSMVLQFVRMSRKVNKIYIVWGDRDLVLVQVLTNGSSYADNQQIDSSSV
ncbi:MAG: hypothetical protein SAK29_03260 [Scytonema sp. PMC 1069.18]|nr:hypothetical protein [Scytonema sp. PMC 1069.18]MEC4884243.1 hypothetical protein [Scytonema sp. PMC 1070.18]